jgi:nucleoside 2-deoxyribosyltransferase
MKFKDEFIQTKKELEQMGFDVDVPVYTSTNSTKREHIDEHLKKLKECDVLLLTNYLDDTGYGYVGASGFFEVGWAFALGKDVYLLNKTSPDSPYTEDLDAVVCRVLDGDLSKITA